MISCDAPIFYVSKKYLTFSETIYLTYKQVTT